MAVLIVLSALQFPAMSNFGKRVPGSAPANEPAASDNTPVKKSIPRMSCTRLIEAKKPVSASDVPGVRNRADFVVQTVGAIARLSAKARWEAGDFERC